MIDSHAHIYLDKFKNDISEIIERASESGIDKILMPNIDHTSIDAMLEVEARFPQNSKSMIGLHPCSVGSDFEKELYHVENWISKHPFIAIGEIGTDLYWEKKYFEHQKEAFNIQCELAIEHDLPIVIHCRDSIDETIELVRPFSDEGLKGVFHCFTGSEKQAKSIVDLGFKLGIGGVLTFKNSDLRNSIRKIDPKNFLLETDSPYLAPVPKRGKRNEPSYVRFVAEELAEVLNLELEDLDKETVNNTKTLFNLQ
jgi:TatD DNase family protein